MTELEVVTTRKFSKTQGNIIIRQCLCNRSPTRENRGGKGKKKGQLEQEKEG